MAYILGGPLGALLGWIMHTITGPAAPWILLLLLLALVYRRRQASIEKEKETDWKRTKVGPSTKHNKKGKP